MLALLLDPNAWIALLTLTIPEIVLGIDNIIFIALMAARLPEEQRERARRLGLGFHIPKGCLYFAIAFSLGVEMLNLRRRRRRAAPVHLRGPREAG